MTSCDRYQSKFLQYDLYRRPFNFLLPDHQSQYRSLLGSVLSLLTLILLLIYMNYMFLIFFSSSEFIVNQTRDEYYFKHYEGFSH